MSFVEAVGIALSSLRANRLRSLLTLLGIVIGVMAVIAVVSIISGLNDYVAGKIFNLGPDVVTVTRMSPVITSLDEFIEGQKRKSLYLSDMAAIRAACANCKSVGASVNARARVKFGRDYLDSEIRGFTAEMPALRGYELQAGRFLTEYDVEHARNVVVIGTDIVDNLFPFVDPIGKTLIVDDRPFEVIGVTTKQGSVLGQSQDNWVTIPITLHQKMYGARRSVNIYAKALDEAHVAAAESEIRLTLRARRHLSYEAKDDFALNTNDNFLQIWANISRAFFAVTIGIASISLIVGGIVVMNIMLVSVTERTREIGIRKAAGARRNDILTQFLVESSTLALIGGMIGVCFGASIALAVSTFTPLPASIKWWAVVLGLTVSTTVGLFFGIYPAKKAANLDPIVALRYE
ncbi:MAG: ABC transporter permease [Acidobacteria bacterium]|nr:MAG: ABC transporter permease [Acidobacteriota bacterium]